MSLHLLWDIGCSLDWLTPLVGLVLDVTNGPGFTFVVGNDDAGLARGVIKQERIDVWAMFFVAFENVFTFRCRLGDAGRLWAALEAAGVGLLNTDRPPMLRPVVKAPAVRRPAAVRGRSRLWDLLDK